MFVSGRTLLHLDHNYDVLSLSTLRIGVVSMNVTLRTIPRGCIHSLSAEERLTQVRELLLNDFKRPDLTTESGRLSKNNYVCNMYARNEDGYAIFLYQCCHKDPDGDTICEDMIRDIWINILLACVIVIKIIVVLFSPSFLPESFYRKKFTEADYVYHCPDTKKLKIVATRHPGSFTSPNKIVKFHCLFGMEYFQAMIRNMHVEKVYQVSFNKIRLAVKARRLLPENVVPVGVIKVIFENIFRCKLRNLPPLKPCCERNICGKLNPGFKVISWYKCLRILANIVLMFILVLPWMIRIIIFYSYEANMVDDKHTAAKRMKMKTHFGGSFTMYLTPLHATFIITYLILIFDSLFYGVLKKKLKEKFRYVLRKSLRDMRERSRINTCGWATQLIIRPFKVFGILGFLLAIPYWIIIIPFFVIPVLAFYMLPFLNLSIRFLINLFAFLCPSKFIDKFEAMSEKMNAVKDKLKLNSLEDETFMEKSSMTKRETIFQMVIMLMCLTSFWSMTFLLMECVSFFVELVVYTMMGIIVNAGTTVQYLTVLFLLFIYAKDTFSSVHKKYLNFYKVIFNFLLSLKKEDIQKTARQDENVQENTVFRVERPLTSPDRLPDARIDVKDGYLRWKTNGFLIFLDERDTPFTPVKFFHRSILMNCCGCPGELWLQILRAFVSFGKIVLFLLFVAIVVMAFGDAYKISSTNQMLATVAGGFLPFVLRNIFSRSGGANSVNTDSVQFITEFDNAVNMFEQTWPVADIVPDPYEEYDSTRTKPVDESTSKKSDMGDNSEEADDEEDTKYKDVESGVNSTFLESIDAGYEDEQTVDLIVDVANIDRRHRRLGMPGSPDEVGSISMLADGNTSRSPIYTKSTYIV